jgi:hypothetical protein
MQKADTHSHTHTHTHKGVLPSSPLEVDVVVLGHVQAVGLVIVLHGREDLHDVSALTTDLCVRECVFVFV